LPANRFRRAGILLLLTLWVILLCAGCAGKSSKEAEPEPAPTPVGQADEIRQPSASPSQAATSSSQVIKSNNPIADPEAQEVLQELEAEVDELLKVLGRCEEIQDEDLQLGGDQTQ